MDQKLKIFIFSLKFRQLWLSYGQWQKSTERRKLSHGNTMKSYPNKSFAFNIPNTKKLTNIRKCSIFSLKVRIFFPDMDYIGTRKKAEI